MPVLLDDPATAGRELARLQGEREIAVDTEGASFHRFVDRVYLVQLSTRGRTAILDPLSLDARALDPVRLALENPAVEKVFHDADYDLRLLQRDYGWQVRNVFDTRVAAQLLGIAAFGLAALLERYFGVKLDKKHQRADWSMRPLPPEMLRYAAQDTMYLLDLRDLLHRELEAKGRMSWAREEFERLEGTRWSDDDGSAAFLRLKGARDLSRRELAVLRELVDWRDTVARNMDRATFRVMGNEQLLEIARLQPRTPVELGRIRGASRALLERRGGEILSAVRRALEVADADLPKLPKGPRWERIPEFDARVSALKAARDLVAGQLKLDPAVLCAREKLEAVARLNPTTPEELQELPALRSWQRELLAAAFVAALAKLRR